MNAILYTLLTAIFIWMFNRPELIKQRADGSQTSQDIVPDYLIRLSAKAEETVWKTHILGQLKIFSNYFRKRFDIDNCSYYVISLNKNIQKQGMKAEVKLPYSQANTIAKNILLDASQKPFVVKIKGDKSLPLPIIFESVGNTCPSEDVPLFVEPCRNECSKYRSYSPFIRITTSDTFQVPDLMEDEIGHLPITDVEHTEDDALQAMSPLIISCQSEELSNDDTEIPLASQELFEAEDNAVEPIMMSGINVMALQPNDSDDREDLLMPNADELPGVGSNAVLNTENNDIIPCATNGLASSSGGAIPNEVLAPEDDNIPTGTIPVSSSTSYSNGVDSLFADAIAHDSNMWGSW